MNSLRNAFRVAERCANNQTPTYVCRTCRTQLAETQQRQLHIVKPQSRLITTSRAFTATSQAQAEQDDGFAQYPDPKKDPSYVEALTSEGLEWVGSDKWVEDNQDVGDNFEGWKQATQNQYNVKFANSAVLQVAQRVLDKQTLSSHQLHSPEQTIAAGATSQKSAWLSMPLTDPKIKFEMVKGLAEITGYRISDYQLQNVKTWKGLRDTLMRRPASKKLYKRLRNSQAFVDLPNVSLVSRRVTPIHKEKAVGRWQLIKEELEDRGLPVTGFSTKVKKSFPLV